MSPTACALCCLLTDFLDSSVALKTAYKELQQLSSVCKVRNDNVHLTIMIKSQIEHGPCNKWELKGSATNSVTLLNKRHICSLVIAPGLLTNS